MRVAYTQALSIIAQPLHNTMLIYTCTTNGKGAPYLDVDLHIQLRHSSMGGLQTSMLCYMLSSHVHTSTHLHAPIISPYLHTLRYTFSREEKRRKKKTREKQGKEDRQRETEKERRKRGVCSERVGSEGICWLPWLPMAQLVAAPSGTAKAYSIHSLHSLPITELSRTYTRIIV